jgi:hypothetical protein
MRLGDGHRHVQVGHASVEAGLEDGHVEERVDGVDHRIRTGLADKRDDCIAARCVDCVPAEATVVELADERSGRAGS